MDLSIGILKVLASYPDGKASVNVLKADLAMLATREWFDRMQVLAARAGSVKIFDAGLVTRDRSGWAITEAGREFLATIEEEQHRGE